MRLLTLPLMLFVMLLVAGCSTTAMQQERATELRPGQTYYGQLASGSRLFRFTLDRPTSVILSATTPVMRTLPGGYNGRLLDADGQLIAEDRDSGEGFNFRIAERLDAGTYYLEMRQLQACSSRLCLNENMSFTLMFRVDRG
ncbi:hypothetical protein [Halomonas salipaludis]|uniref:Lipoprotein n=1 Tax=Halomonas salipaludis TaxID=2032625 RepID=A0A2A2ETA4_9GAMM|nr:hypothetical protein [Halomonas salipaludis]PAU76661.1 hypothetical protein CK498_11765 [Halomonas salipaludis]